MSYTQFLEQIDSGQYANIRAPKVAIDYWKLNDDATLRNVIIVVRNDEASHRDQNHDFADDLSVRD